MNRWADYLYTPPKTTPLYDTWYGDEETFANYGGYDGENND